MTRHQRLTLRMAYARILSVAVYVAFFLLLVVSVLYFSGAVASRTPLNELHRYWGESLEEFREAVGAPARPWEWTQEVLSAEGLAHVPIAFLGLLTMAGYLRIAIPFARAGDYAYLAIVVAELVVLGIAAAGLLSGG
jgi:hypothetical protein